MNELRISGNPTEEEIAAITAAYQVLLAGRLRQSSMAKTTALYRMAEELAKTPRITHSWRLAHRFQSRLA
jgi:hypothetical protein